MRGRVTALGRELGRGLLQLLYPGACGACGLPLAPGETAFCRPCRAALTADPLPACCRCAGTVGPHVPTEEGCPRCRGTRFHFDRAIRLAPYDGLLREAILRMKQGHGEMTAELLGDLWAAHAEAPLRAANADVVVPVPLHWWRRWVRGYNQSETLARCLANRLNLPCRPAWLRRIRYTPLQTCQTPAGRLHNVRGAFRAGFGARLQGLTVLLVDDVLTTGSTCSEAAKALRKAGAARVVVGVLAHSRG